MSWEDSIEKVWLNSANTPKKPLTINQQVDTIIYTMEETKRKLASIQTIKSLTPIEGADRIEVAEVLGWHVVVKKGEFKVGDLVVYCEVDSLLPIRTEYAFLQSGGVKKMLHEGKEVEGYRLKTVRLKGQISQGICFPLSILPEHSTIPVEDVARVEGADVTDLLGIIKYERPVPESMAGKMRGNFPGFIPKTDETRLQTVPKILEKYRDVSFYVTEKLDGSSVTFFIKDDEFHVCSRNTDLLETPDNLIWKVAREMDIEGTLRDMGGKYALQGEIVGGKVQGNKLKLSQPTIYFFSVFDMERSEYVDFEEVMHMIGRYKLQFVPVVEHFFTLKQTVDEMVQFATRTSELNPEVWVEGLVFRPRKEMRDEDLGRLSFKVINPEFLLKNDE